MSEMQKDLVLSINEYAYVLDRTKGNVSCWVGPAKTSLSTSDELVRFDENSKQFIPCSRYSEATNLFVTAPENWYIALKNPAADGRHPTAGTANSNPEKMDIGCKVNIPGPISFALYAGQMAKVIKGHTLRSNQYLLARVYDAQSLNKSRAEREAGDNEPEFVNGQILVIKGTDISFYLPPTGIEVIPIHNDDRKGYVRDAVTLERLEYCILKDEDGNKRYVHGPEVVFPEPTESFIHDKNNQIKYRAVELSEISGVYVKVIADYADEDGTEHKTGEELFITGKEQMIYYPRPEHSFITYNDQIRHHAIAIPKGQGKYIMDRMTGDIKTVVGPAMYLPDPRKEVVVRRTLSKSECNLMYPGNDEVLAANGHMTSVTASKDLSAQDFIKAVSRSANYINTDAISSSSYSYLDNYNGTRTKADVDLSTLSESDGSGIARQNMYTPPRTISLAGSKFDGAVSVDVWTGYAVNIISKDGSRKVVQGPHTILLDYDQTLEMLQLSTGKPKTTDFLESTVFLRYENNRVSDIINIETNDFVQAQIKVSYLVDFDPKYSDKWFSVDNYVKHLCDWCRSTLKQAARTHNISDFCSNYHEIVHDALNADTTEDGCMHFFKENGMKIVDVEVLSMAVESEIQDMIDAHQQKIVSRTLDLTAAQQSADVDKEIMALTAEKFKLESEYKTSRMEEQARYDARAFELRVEENKAADEEEKRARQTEQEIQKLKDAIAEANLVRKTKEHEAEIAHAKALAEIETKKQQDMAKAMVEVLGAVGPELAAAMQSQNNQETVSAIASAIAPYAVANGESVSEAVDRLVRGSSLQDLLEKVVNPLA